MSDNRQYKEAQALGQAILKVDPSNAAAHTLVGETFVLMNDLPNALAELTKAMELDPKRVEGYAAVGAVYLAQGKTEDAEAAYRKATEVNPNSVQAHIALGEFFFSRRKMPQAEASIRTACSLDSHAVLPRLLLGRIYILTGRSADAENLYAKLKIMAPDDARAYQALGLYYLSLGRKEKRFPSFRPWQRASRETYRLRFI